MSAASTVIVTGASSGIGRAVAEVYARRGARVVLVGRDEVKLAAVTRSLGAPERTASVAGDIADPQVVERVFALARDRFGGIEILVNVAGVFGSRPFLDYTTTDLEQFVRTNLQGTVLPSQAAVRELRRRGATGAIVNVSSAISIQPLRQTPASIPNAIKAAVSGFTKSLALEVAAEGIRVNAVAPGVIKTPLLGERERYDDLLGMQPMGRIGEPEDVAEAIVYLASARFVTGVVLPVDGGMTVGHW